MNCNRHFNSNIDEKSDQFFSYCWNIVEIIVIDRYEMRESNMTGTSYPTLKKYIKAENSGGICRAMRNHRTIFGASHLCMSSSQISFPTFGFTSFITDSTILLMLARINGGGYTYRKSPIPKVVHSPSDFSSMFELKWRLQFIVVALILCSLLFKLISLLFDNLFDFFLSILSDGRIDRPCFTLI